MLQTGNPFWELGNLDHPDRSYSSYWSPSTKKFKFFFFKLLIYETSAKKLSGINIIVFGTPIQTLIKEAVDHGHLTLTTHNTDCRTSGVDLIRQSAAYRDHDCGVYADTSYVKISKTALK